jgi:lipid-binding SYLF domain-containing protein
MTLHQRFASILATVGALALVSGCTSAPKNEAAAKTMQEVSRTTLDKFEAQDKTLAAVLDTSAGYAVFSSVGKAGFIVGAAYGTGVVYEHGAVIGTSDIKQASIGFQAGGQDYDELVIFREQDALDRFKTGSFAMSAEASAVALKAGAAAQADFKQGVAVFTVTNSGLMAEAAVAGQRFGYTSSTVSTTQEVK